MSLRNDSQYFVKFPYSFWSVSVLCFQSKPLFKHLMFLLLYYFTTHSRFQNILHKNVYEVMNQTSYPGQFLDACQVPNCHCHYVYCIVNFHLSSMGKLIFGEHVLKHAQQDLFSLSPLVPDLSIWNSHNSLQKVFHKVYHFSLMRKLEKKKKNPFTLTQCAFAQIRSEYMQLKLLHI